jgi:hypothetical protein
MHVYKLPTSGDVSLVAATAKTLLQLVTPSTRRAQLLQSSASFNSTSATDPSVLIEWLLQTTAGTASALTPKLVDQADPPALCTAQDIFTAEPTASTILSAIRLTPIGGTIVLPERWLAELTLLVSGKYGLRMTSPNNLSNVRAELMYRE